MTHMMPLSLAPDFQKKGVWCETFFGSGARLDAPGALKHAATVSIFPGGLLDNPQ